MRYFVKMDVNTPHCLYKFEVQPQRILEERWHKGTWTPSTNIAGYLMTGDGDYEEVTPSLAKTAFPEAFEATGTFEMQKADGEKRFTLGAMYIPDRVDAHNEWTDAEELQKAVWDYVRSGDRRIRLQHNRDVVAGEWLEVMSFPYEITVPIKTISGIEVNHTYPPNTVFLGVQWEPWAWDMVKSEKILGYSIGGRAERLYVDMQKADGPTVSDVHVDTIMNPKKKKPKKDS